MEVCYLRKYLVQANHYPTMGFWYYNLQGQIFMWGTLAEGYCQYRINSVVNC